MTGEDSQSSIIGGGDPDEFRFVDGTQKAYSKDVRAHVLREYQARRREQALERRRTRKSISRRAVDLSAAVVHVERDLTLTSAAVQVSATISDPCLRRESAITIVQTSVEVIPDPTSRVPTLEDASASILGTTEREAYLVNHCKELSAAFVHFLSMKSSQRSSTSFPRKPARSSFTRCVTSFDHFSQKTLVST